MTHRETAFERNLRTNQEYIMRVLNKKYWPYHVAVNQSGDAERWCYKNLKSSEWRNVGKYYAFKQSGDAMMFKLKWA